MGRSERRTDAQTHRRTKKRGAQERRTEIRRTDAPRVLVTRKGGIATLTLNRPEKRNALDRATIAELRAALTTCDLAADVRVLVLRGAGKDFCAGADLAELLASVDLPAEENERRAMELGEVFLALRDIPKPTVAVVRGRALAGGCGLATACDLVVAHPDAVFGYPEIDRGFVPAMVLAILRRAVGEKVAFDLVATGRLLEAAAAERLGLISRVLPSKGFEREVTKVLERLAGASPSALALIKQQFTRLDGMGFAEGIRLGAQVNAVARRSPDFRKAVAAFLGK
jgi:methylglutaconyl-CoA hydratase